MNIVIDLAYIVSAAIFIIGLKMLGRQESAVRGNLVSAGGMALAIAATLLNHDLIHTYWWIVVGVLIGSAIGAIAAIRVPMTSMPEFVALFNGTGGIASLLVGWSEFNTHTGTDTWSGSAYIVPVASIFLATVIGGVTFSGSGIAYAKLAERMNSKALLYKGQQIVNVLVVLAILACGAIMLMGPNEPIAYAAFGVTIFLALVLGVLATIPIGGADMPVVISLLNSYSGLAACAAGFAIGNTVLVVSGSLVGASGIILTNIMCKAMNRSLANVLFSGFGAVTESGGGGGKGPQGEAKAITAEDAYYVLEAAASVVFVPGYGMAVAQAQHVVRELGELLEENGAVVKYAIHPVAGRMPGHMNVLLAEANVPYEQLVEMDDINPELPATDVAIVIGANDVVNPAAREDPDSSIYGMPIINVDHARTCFVLKRSMSAGFAGIQNPLFFKENNRMLFGDAKASIQALINEFKST